MNCIFKRYGAALARIQTQDARKGSINSWMRFRAKQTIGTNRGERQFHESFDNFFALAECDHRSGHLLLQQKIQSKLYRVNLMFDRKVAKISAYAVRMFVELCVGNKDAFRTRELIEIIPFARPRLQHFFVNLT